MTAISKKQSRQKQLEYISRKEEQGLKQISLFINPDYKYLVKEIARQVSKKKERPTLDKAMLFDLHNNCFKSQDDFENEIKMRVDRIAYLIECYELFTQKNKEVGTLT